MHNNWSESIKGSQSLELGSEGLAKRSARGKERAETDDAKRLPLGRSHCGREASKPAKAETNHPADQTRQRRYPRDEMPECDIRTPSDAD